MTPDERARVHETMLRTATFLMVASAPHPIDFTCSCLPAYTCELLAVCYPSDRAMTN